MGRVCGERELDGWLRGRCQKLASALFNAMSAISFDNREGLDVQNVCHSFWTEEVAVEKAARAEKERAEAEAEQAAVVTTAAPGPDNVAAVAYATNVTKTR